MSDKQKVEISDEQWMAHRQILLQAEVEQAASVDKHLLTLSSGAVGLSTVYFFNLSKGIACWTKPFLVLAWFGFTLSILATLASFVASQAGYRERRDEWDEMYSSGFYDPDCARDNRYEKRTKRLNRWAMRCFALGIVFFIVFAIGNLF